MAIPVGSSDAGSADGSRSSQCSGPPSSCARAAAHLQLLGHREVGDGGERHHAAQFRRGGQPPRGTVREDVPGSGPQREVAAGGVAGDDGAAEVGLREGRRGERGEGVHGGGDVVEGLRPAAGDRAAGVLVRQRTPAPVFDVGHGKTAPGEEVREGGDVLPVVRGPPRAAVQDDHQRHRAAGFAARGVEVDDVVGVFAVGGRHVRRDRRVGEGRGGLGGVPFHGGGVRHRVNLSVTRGTAGTGVPVSRQSGTVSVRKGNFRAEPEICRGGRSHCPVRPAM